jgi:mono/diheme cytochrome c family protein
MRRAALVLTAVLVVAGAAIGAAQGNPEAAKLKNPVAASAESVAAGKAAFAKNCRFCHGADAKGDGPMAPKDTHPSNLTDAKWDRGSTDGEIFAVIRDGAGPKFDMKGYKSKMTDTEMWNIVNFLRSVGAK